MVKASAESLLTSSTTSSTSPRSRPASSSSTRSPFDAARSRWATRSKSLALRAHAEGAGAGLPTSRPTCPTRVVGDPGRLRQIVVNLVGNAIKFTERGRGGRRRATWRARPTASVAAALRASRDTGIGIPADKQRDDLRAVRAGRRLDDAPYGGTGLGLAISRRAGRADGRPHLGRERAGPGQHLPLHACRSHRATELPAAVRVPSRLARGLPRAGRGRQRDQPPHPRGACCASWGMQPTPWTGGRGRRWRRCGAAARRAGRSPWCCSTPDAGDGRLRAGRADQRATGRWRAPRS